MVSEKIVQPYAVGAVTWFGRHSRPYNFERIPVILTDPYHYSEASAPAVADLGGGDELIPAVSSHDGSGVA